MLGKLLKYDLRSVSRILLPLHGGLILLTLLERITMSLVQNIDNLPRWPITLITTIYVIYIIVTFAATLILLVNHFYKSMYSDQGYLSFTLPVNPSSHLLSKTITALIWYLLDGIVITGCIFAVIYNPALGSYRAINRFAAEFRDLWEYNDMFVSFVLKQLPFIILIIIMGGILTYVRFYMCFTIGQLSNQHRFAFGLLTWFGLNVIRQVLSIIFNIVLVATDLGDRMIDYISTETMTVDDLTNFLLLSEGITLLITVVLVVIYWLITAGIMRRKLNLA